MFSAYFGGLTTGRLARLPFLGFLLLLAVLFVLYGLGIVFGIGVADHLLRGDLPGAEGYLIERIGLPGISLLGLFVLAFAFAKWNLIAKRIRDMGLPGWRVLLLFVLAEAGFAYLMDAGGVPLSETYPLHGIVSGLVTWGLLLIPGGLFGRRAAAAT